MADSVARELERLVAKARADQDVLAVFHFGSRVRGEAGPSSDVDVCLVLTPRPVALGPLDRSRKRMEYLEHSALDVTIYQDLPIYIRRRILKEGRLLFARDEALLYEVARRTAQAYEDFRPIYQAYLDEVARGGP